MIEYITKIVAQLGSPDSLNIPRNQANSAALNDILGVVYFVAGVACVIAIIIGGFYYVASNGDSGRIAKGKNILLYAVIGLVVVGMAFAITQFVIGRIQG